MTASCNYSRGHYTLDLLHGLVAAQHLEPLVDANPFSLTPRIHLPPFVPGLSRTNDSDSLPVEA